MVEASFLHNFLNKTIIFIYLFQVRSFTVVLNFKYFTGFSKIQLNKNKLYFSSLIVTVTQTKQIENIIVCLRYKLLLLTFKVGVENKLGLNEAELVFVSRSVAPSVSETVKN